MRGGGGGGWVTGVIVVWVFKPVFQNGGRGECNLRVIVVQVSKPVFQNLPQSYTWPLKKWTHFRSSEMFTHSYTAF